MGEIRRLQIPGSADRYDQTALRVSGGKLGLEPVSYTHLLFGNHVLEFLLRQRGHTQLLRFRQLTAGLFADNQRCV